MQHIALPVKDAFIIQHPRYYDNRGFLEELYNADKYPSQITEFFPVQQVTTASSTEGVLRGLHFSPYCKLLSVTKGSLYDVVVDLRPDSPTYLKWCGVVLSETNCRQLFIPPDCGHGYFALQDETAVVYCQGGCFKPATDRGINPFDKLVNVAWQVGEVLDYLVSDKDRAAPMWTDLTPDALGIPLQRKRLLLVGVNSQTGLAMSDVFESRGRYLVYGTTHTIDSPFSMKLDLSAIAKDREQCRLVINACRPHVVIICGAYNHVDGCETTPEKSETINIKGTQALMEECKSVGAKVVYLSSNYVFGENVYKSAENNIVGNSGLRETDKTAPPNVYARHKLETEGHVIATSPGSIVIRTSNVYGPSVAGRNNNFVYQMSRAFRNKRKYICSTTEMVVPSYTYDIATAVALLIDRDESGIFHVCGPESFSKHEWAMRVGRQLKLSSETIEKLEGMMSSPAARPQAAVMCTAKLRGAVDNLRMHTFSEGMDHWMQLGKGEPI